MQSTFFFCFSGQTLDWVATCGPWSAKAECEAGCWDFEGRYQTMEKFLGRFGDGTLKRIFKVEFLRGSLLKVRRV